MQLKTGRTDTLRTVANAGLPAEESALVETFPPAAGLACQLGQPFGAGKVSPCCRNQARVAIC